MKNFLLIDDHEVVRSGVKNVLLELFKPCAVFDAYDEESAENFANDMGNNQAGNPFDNLSPREFEVGSLDLIEIGKLHRVS